MTAHAYAMQSAKLSSASMGNKFLPLVDFTAQREHDTRMQLLEKCLAKENNRERKLAEAKSMREKSILRKKFDAERRVEQQLVLQMISSSGISIDENPVANKPDETENESKRCFMLVSSSTADQVNEKPKRTDSTKLKKLPQTPDVGFTRYSERHSIKPPPKPDIKAIVRPRSKAVAAKKKPNIQGIYAEPFPSAEKPKGRRGSFKRCSTGRTTTSEAQSQVKVNGSITSYSEREAPTEIEAEIAEEELDAAPHSTREVETAAVKEAEEKEAKRAEEEIVNFLQDEATKIKNAKDEEEAMERAVSYIQKITRGHLGRKMFQKERYSTAIECGVLGAMPGTIQGKTGWYQDHRSLVAYNFEVTKSGNWIQNAKINCSEEILTPYQMNQLIKKFY